MPEKATHELFTNLDIYRIVSAGDTCVGTISRNLHLPYRRSHSSEVGSSSDAILLLPECGFQADV